MIVYSQADSSEQVPLWGCNPPSLVHGVSFKLTYTDASGNDSASAALYVKDNGTYSLLALGNDVQGDYTGGHMHDGPITGSVFYNGKMPKPHSADLIVFILDGVTTATIGSGSHKKGNTGSGAWRHTPEWLKVGTDKSIAWTVV